MNLRSSIWFVSVSFVLAACAAGRDTSAAPSAANSGEATVPTARPSATGAVTDDRAHALYEMDQAGVPDSGKQGAAQIVVRRLTARGVTDVKVVVTRDGFDVSVPLQ